MSIINKRFRKPLLIIGASIIAFVALVIIFISPIAKYLVEKYDVKYTGREITMDWAYVNPFTGYVYFNDVVIHEYQTDSIFISMDGLSANFALLKMMNKTYEISNLTLTNPYAIVIQEKKVFNFDDLITKFSSKEEHPDTTKEPTHFNLLDIKIKNGEFHYRDKVTPVNYFVKKVNIESEGLRWDVDSITSKFAFTSGIGTGDMKGEFSCNFESSDYRLAVKADKFSLDLIEQYMQDLANYGNLSALLSADIKSSGNFKDEQNVTTSGKIIIDDFHMGKTKLEDYVAFDKLSVNIIEVSPINKKFFFDSIVLSKPYLKYEKYDQLDNLQTMFGNGGSNISEVKSDNTKFNLILEIADYMKVLSKNFFESDYKIKRLAIYEGDLIFNDYSTSEKFSVQMNPLKITADSIDKNKDWVHLYLTSGVVPYGNINLTFNMNPKDNEDFTLNYNFTNLPASMFNPYTLTYTSYTLNRGTIETNGRWDVNDGHIISSNHLIIIDPRAGKKVKNKDQDWLPMPLILAIIRENSEAIDYEIPITGNLKNPKFHLRDVIFDVLRNIFVKPVTTPYRMNVRSTEKKIEKSLTLNWQLRSSDLTTYQEKFIGDIAEYLKHHSDATINVVPRIFVAKEKEYILFFEAKKKYYLAAHDLKILSKEDSLKVSVMSVKDPDFVKYLDSIIKDSLVFTVQEKCARVISPEVLRASYTKLLEDRKNLFMAYFREKGVDKQVKFLEVDDKIPYNGFSFYRIEYNGDVPSELLEAYDKMLKLNDEAPRDKYERRRKFRIKSIEEIKEEKEKS